METNEISIHEAVIYSSLRGSAKWMTNREIAKATARPVAERTVRHHTRRLVALGLLDLAEVFPAHRYRVSEMADKRNAAYVNRLKAACEVFEIKW